LKNTTALSLKWMKAAAIGSLWGSVEVILGSFLHNIGLPVAGIILASLGVILLVASNQLWKENGIIWRAGLICALMKSISPSAIIFGPMICIFLEALLLEFSIFIFGKNLFGYMIGGGLALSSSLVYKLVTWLITYGFSIVKLYVNMYSYAAKQVTLENLSASQVIMMLFGLYILYGATAAVIGYFTGRQSRKQEKRTLNISATEKKEMFQVNTQQKFSLPLLFLHPILIISGIVIINFLPFYYALIFFTAYIVFCILMYHSSMRRLKKPMLWFQLFILTVLAALFIKGMRTGGNIFNFEGLIAGLQMNLRAVFMIVGMASLSVEFRNPKIKNAFSGKSYDRLYMSLELSFEALPSIMKALNRPKEFLRYPMRSIAFLINHAEGLLDHFQEKNKRGPSLIIITGERSEGKTTFLKKIINSFKTEGIEMKGFLSSVVFENLPTRPAGRQAGQAGKIKTGYNLQNISDNAEMNFIRIAEFPGMIKFRKYYFSHDAIAWGNKILLSYKENSSGILIIDEIGPWELEGGGWAESLNKLVELPRFKMIWVVRNEILDDVIKKWDLETPVIIDVSKTSLDSAKNIILKTFPA
jgi:nucleoside-triphosphatase THEP1